jgi:aquaporin Z
MGPVVFVGGDALSHLWPFMVAPVLGGIIAAVAWRAIFRRTY